MARILEYQQDKLASSVVGVPSQDHSGEIIGEAVAKLGNQVAAVAGQAVRQRKDMLDTAAVADLASKYEVGLYDHYSKSINDPAYQQNPSAIEKGMQDASKGLLSQLGLDKQSISVQRAFGAKKLDLDVSYYKKTKEWGRGQENFNATVQLQNDIVRRSNAVADAARQGQLGSAVDLMKGLDLTAASSASVLGPVEAAKIQREASRSPREALFAGLLESDPLLADKILDHEGLDFKSHFTSEEIAQKRDLAKQSMLKWNETQKINVLQEELNDNRALSAAVAKGETPWELLSKMPATPYKDYIVKAVVATENSAMTPQKMAYEKQQLTNEFKKISASARENQTIDQLQAINKFQTAVARAGALQIIDKPTMDKWVGKATQVLSKNKRERNWLGKVAGVNGLKDTEALMASWEQIDSWSKMNKGVLSPDAEFAVFTRLIDTLDPTKSYNDAELRTLVTDEIGSYTRETQVGMNMSTYASGVLRKGAGYTPFHVGPSKNAVPGAKQVTSSRKEMNLKMTDGTSRRGWYDAESKKYYDSAMGGAEIK